MQRISLEALLEELAEIVPAKVREKVIDKNNTIILYKEDDLISDTIPLLSFWALARLAIPLRGRGSFSQLSAAHSMRESKNLLAAYMPFLSEHGLVSPVWDEGRNTILYVAADLKDYTIELTTAEWKAVKNAA